MIIILLGPPGSGKGTQGERIEKNFSFKKFSTGDLLREAVRNKTNIGQKVEQIMKNGDLVSDEMMNELIKELVESSNWKNQKGIILDGYPRTVKQAEFLDDILQKNGELVDVIINFDVDHDVLIDRIVNRYSCCQCSASYNKKYKNPLKDGICDNCGGSDFSCRADDEEEVVTARLKTYEKQTHPLVEFYSEQSKLKHVDGMKKIQEISDEIDFIIKNKSKDLT